MTDIELPRFLGLVLHPAYSDAIVWFAEISSLTSQVCCIILMQTPIADTSFEVSYGVWRNGHTLGRDPMENNRLVEMIRNMLGPDAQVVDPGIGARLALTKRGVSLLSKALVQP